MKSRVGLALSIGLNLGLAGALFWLWNQKLSTPSGQLVVNDAPAGTNDVAIQFAEAPSIIMRTNIDVRGFTWRAVESTDYRKYIENLRKIGCPERTIRDIIVSDVNELYATRLRDAVAERVADFRYWTTGVEIPGIFDEGIERTVRSLEAERDRLLKDLLDASTNVSLYQVAELNFNQLMLGFLSEEKRAAINRIDEDFTRRELELVRADDTGREETAEALAELRREKQVALAGVLTPEEMQRYELTLSPLAMSLRVELGGFEPTEEEFQAVYDVQKAALTNPSVDMLASLADTLPPDRLRELERVLSVDYRELNQLAAGVELPRESVDAVYDLQKILTEEERRVVEQSDLTPEQQEAALVAIRAETERTILETHGEAALQAYRDWLNAGGE